MAEPGKLDKSLWPSFLEKAFAKFWGNYFRTEGGLPELAIRTLLGGPYSDWNHEDSSTTAEVLWDAFKAADAGNDMIQAWTPGQGNHDILHKNGLSHSHAYTILGVKELSNGVRLLKLRNPWGKENYKGDWADDSDKWTDDLR